MGQLCCKCAQGQEHDEVQQGEPAGDRSTTEAPLLTAAVPPAVESPSQHSPVLESPVAEPLVPKSPEEESPVAEPLIAESPVAEFLKVAPHVAESSVPRESPAPVTQQQHDQDDGSGPSLAPGTPAPAPSFTPPKGDHLEFPILQDVGTVEYVQKSKVLVILKGLPGSGKSYLARMLKQVYKDAVVCSADHYFMRSGKYQFNPEELTQAHESCQERAKQAAVSGVSVIAIDNTNIRSWNYKYYLGLSRDHHYTPLIMEPQTPWAKNTKELARKNNHGVKKEIIDQKLKTYEAALPIYYWWFLNEADSAQIIAQAQAWLKKALQVQDFFQDFSKFSKLSSIKEMLRYYKRNEERSDYKVLHATASVVRRGKAKNAKEYIARQAVKDSLGKGFTLQLIGFVITPQTFGVRLRLGEDALELWGLDDHETEAEDTAGKQPAKAGPGSAKKTNRVNLANTGVRRNSCQTTLRDGPSQLHEHRFAPTAGRGSRAHLTLGCAPGVSAKMTGFDLIKVVSCEQEMLKTENLQQSSEKVQTFSLTEGELRTYGDGIWVIYPEKEIHVDSLFSGFY